MHDWREMKRDAVLGLAVVLLMVGFGVAFIPVTRVTEEIRKTFDVSPGSRYGPYDSGTVYHTRVLVKSALRVEVFVEGDEIYITVNGYNTQNLKSVCVEGSKTFLIEPADDLYTFTFDNSRGTKGSLVGFRLSEIWKAPIWIGSTPLFMAAVIGVFLLLPVGLVSLAMIHLRYPRKDNKCQSTKL